VRCISLSRELHLNAVISSGKCFLAPSGRLSAQTSGTEGGNCAVFVTGSASLKSAQIPMVPKRMRFAWRLTERFDRVGLVVVDVEHRVEFGQLKQVTNLFGQFEELYLAALILGRGVGGYQLSQA
jgi:hypothetical protein